MSLEELFQHARETGSLQLGGIKWSKELLQRFSCIDFPIVKVSFPTIKYVDMTAILCMFDFLQRQPTLKVIVFSEPSNGYSWIHDMILALKNLPNLTHLDISGMTCTDTDIRIFGEIFEKSKTLASLGFNYAHWERGLKRQIFKSYSITYVDLKHVPHPERTEISEFLSSNRRRPVCLLATLCWIFVGKILKLPRDVRQLIAEWVWASRKHSIWGD